MYKSEPAATPAAMAMWTEARFATVDFDKADWTLTEKGLFFKGFPAAVACEAELLLGPHRWNDDPKQSLQVTVTSDALVKWVQDLEAWLAPQMKGEARSAVRSNIFGETFVRAKITPETRFYDSTGERAPKAPGASTRCQFLLAPRPYTLNGAVGLSLRALAIQPK